MTILFSFIVLFTASSFAASFVEIIVSPVYCSAGTYLAIRSDDESCIPCGPGTFNDQKSHRQAFCEKCTAYNKDDPFLELVKKCTPTYDNVFRCRPKELYFSQEDKTCTPCSVCETQGLYLGRICTDYNDTACCPHEDMVFWDGECRLITHCGVGQYLRYGHRGQQDSCLPCPVNTTNYEFKHRRSSCRYSCYECGRSKELCLTEKSISCGAGECEVGKSCTRENGVVCTPCMSFGEKPQRRDTTPSEKNSKYLEVEVSESRAWGCLSLMVPVTVLMLSIVCVYRYSMSRRRSVPYDLLIETNDTEQGKKLHK